MIEVDILYDRAIDLIITGKVSEAKELIKLYAEATEQAFSYVWWCAEKEAEDFK